MSSSIDPDIHIKFYDKIANLCIVNFLINAHITAQSLINAHLFIISWLTLSYF